LPSRSKPLSRGAGNPRLRGRHPTGLTDLTRTSAHFRHSVPRHPTYGHRSTGDDGSVQPPVQGEARAIGQLARQPRRMAPAISRRPGIAVAPPARRPDPVSARLTVGWCRASLSSCYSQYLYCLIK
jgi:hypothetical protein